jgi:hypothetical protein
MSSTTLSITCIENQNLLSINNFIHIHRDVSEAKTLRVAMQDSNHCPLSLMKETVVEANRTYRMQSSGTDIFNWAINL